MKVIFLDIDGVLNNAESIRSNRTNLIFDQNCVQQLNRVTATTGAKIVISSNWREGIPLWHVQAIIGSRGVEGDIIGMTPDLKRLEGLGPEDKHVFWVRAHEISRWLEANPWVTRYAVIDDHVVRDHDGFFFKTDLGYGLTSDIADSIIKFFEV